jgi:hypothetical protein
MPDHAVTVSQSARQGRHNGFAAATRVLAELVADLIGRFGPHVVVGIPEGTQECGHHLRIAEAVVPVAEPVNGCPPLPR